MKIVKRLFSFVIAVLYFICAAVGSLLVIPCRLLSILCCLGGIILIVGEEVINWYDYLPCFVVGVLIYILPSFLAIYIGKFLLWIDRTVNSV